MITVFTLMIIAGTEGTPEPRFVGPPEESSLLFVYHPP